MKTEYNLPMHEQLITHFDKRAIAMEKSPINYDAVIVGGGMVGSAAALGLAKAGWHVAVIEHQKPLEFDINSPPDLRISAIGHRSVQLLKDLGAWQAIMAMRSAPYRNLETWELPKSEVSFSASSLDLQELGYMVENPILQLGLWQQLAHYSNIMLFCPAEMKSLQKAEQGWQVELNNGHALGARLIIGADGAKSQIRKWEGIGTTGWQYPQSCMLISIKTDGGQKDTTWQQFFPSGPRAFLPLYDNWASLVWYDSPSRIRQLQKLTLTELTDEIKHHFPARLGAFSAINVGSFPLVRRHAQQYVKPGLALIGDAAHTINPLAGQGVNLGYRDVEALLDILIQARQRQEDWSGETVLKRYQSRRYADNLLMQNGMDIFYYAFSNNLTPIKMLRNLALKAAQRSGQLKLWALKYAIGL